MVQRRRFLKSLAFLPAVAVLPRAALARAKDPKVAFLGFGPPEQAERIEMVREKVEGFGQRYGFRIVPLGADQLEEEDLDHFAAFVFYGAGLEQLRGEAQISGRAIRSLEKVVRKKGRGVLAIHGAAGISPSQGKLHRNQARRSEWVKLLGGESVRSLDRRHGRVRMADRSVPGLTALRSGFELEERWLALKNFDPKMHVIMVQDTAALEGALYDRPSYPLTWLRYHGRGRVFYTGLGYEESAWESDVLRRSVVGGALWVLRDTEADVSANLMRVTPKAIQAEYPV